MIEVRSWVALGACSAAVVACGTDTIGPGATGGTGSFASSAGAGGSAGVGTGGTGGVANAGAPAAGASAGGMGGGAGNGGGGTGAIDGQGHPLCSAGIPTSTQIPRLLKRQYDAVMRDLLGVTTMSDGKPPSAGLYDDYDGPMNADAWRLYKEVGARVASEFMAGADKSKFISCEPTTSGCLVDTIRAFGRKAFRRPMTETEVTSFTRLTTLTPAGTPAQQAESILSTFLISPSFLQIPELLQEQEAGALKLSQHEVAARLSFLLWGSIPDQLLSDAADHNELKTKDQIRAQAERMIGIREKTAPLVSEFHRRYLDMDNGDGHWWKIDHDKTLYPLYFDNAKDVYGAELDRFFEEVTFQKGTFKDLFLSNVAYVNHDSAQIYGLDPTPYGADLTRVELDGQARPGFLTRLGFLSSFSHFGSTSPILRGAFITINIIGLDPGPPDPNFFLTPPPPGEYPTERKYTEALTGQTACAHCHIPYINPPGFALENYDAIGKWQTVDPRAKGDASTGTIDPTTEVTLTETDVRTVSNARELMEAIVQGAEAKKLYAERWISFSTGRYPNVNDACDVDALSTKLNGEGYTLLALLADLTQTDSFRLRQRATP